MAKRKRGPRPFLAYLSLFLFGFVSLAYFRGTDSLYAVTIWPAWVWAVPGLLLALFSRTWRSFLVPGWLLFAFMFEESVRSIPRMLVSPAPRDFRVVSLNCAGGSIEAAREVAPYRPDIVLLQESPGREDVERLANELFGEEGGAVVGPDASILSRWKPTALELPRSTGNFVIADLSAPERPIRVVSLRLQPPVLRFDLWRLDAWQAYAGNRASRLREIQEMTDLIGSLGEAPHIIGGDFNTPHDPAVSESSSLFGPHLDDSFRQKGRGYGATAVNPWPLVRIDQIWNRRELKAVNVTSHRTKHSDHTLVVADFAWTR